MKRIVYGLKVAWGYWYFFLFVFFFLFFYPILIFMLWSPRGYRAANGLRRIWATIVLSLSGMPWRVKHESAAPLSHGVIYCPNHFSYLDIPAVMLCTRGNVRFMAKMELGNIPVFNIFFKTVDIPVNRGNRAESYKAIKQAEESLDQHYNLVVFPEGTIGPNPPTLLHFKNGPFRLAIEKQAPIVPLPWWTTGGICMSRKKSGVSLGCCAWLFMNQ
jgi:1-acyl-sn-glycerol-3-phosphate acyltransferase